MHGGRLGRPVATRDEGGVRGGNTVGSRASTHIYLGSDKVPMITQMGSDFTEKGVIKVCIRLPPSPGQDMGKVE